jgi:uncharacterized protein with HEPN domain
VKHAERASDYLRHILQAVDRATRYLNGVAGPATLALDEQVQDAVVRNIEIIGEAAVRLQRVAPEVMASHPEIPWLEMRGMRNKMIHQYFDVDWDVVWRTVKSDLPDLKRRIEVLLATLQRREE